mmetsp:Transcript_5849/g.18449  ORF Transcript_5849/g.18449 Transcript_5849/m.18449 type:complete len:210 (+) Transcript_5849:614-1243(+)
MALGAVTARCVPTSLSEHRTTATGRAARRSRCRRSGRPTVADAATSCAWPPPKPSSASATLSPGGVRRAFTEAYLPGVFSKASASSSTTQSRDVSSPENDGAGTSPLATRPSAANASFGVTTAHRGAPSSTPSNASTRRSESSSSWLPSRSSPRNTPRICAHSAWLGATTTVGRFSETGPSAYASVLPQPVSAEITTLSPARIRGMLAH